MRVSGCSRVPLPPARITPFIRAPMVLPLRRRLGGADRQDAWALPVRPSEPTGRHVRAHSIRALMDRQDEDEQREEPAGGDEDAHESQATPRLLGAGVG